MDTPAKQQPALNLTGLMDNVKERIKASFALLIPDENWEKLVDDEIKAFFTPGKIKFIVEQVKLNPNDYWSQTKTVTKIDAEDVSPFRHLVWQFCYDKSVDLLKKKLNDEYFGDNYPFDAETAKEKLKETIAEAAPLGLARLFEAISFNQVNNLRNEIQNFR